MTTQTQLIPCRAVVRRGLVADSHLAVCSIHAFVDDRHATEAGRTPFAHANPESAIGMAPGRACPGTGSRFIIPSTFAALSDNPAPRDSRSLLRCVRHDSGRRASSRLCRPAGAVSWIFRAASAGSHGNENKTQE